MNNMKTNLLLALCLAGCMGYAQNTLLYPVSGTTNSSLGGGYHGPLPLIPSPTFFISRIAGDGTQGYSGDAGQATASELNYPTGVVIDALGNLYIADQSNNRIRKVTTTGIISTFAGNGTWSYSGDGGQATAAEFKTPTGVAIDAVGNLYIADYYNSRIRKVNTAGIISTFAGNGTAGYSGDGGQATSAELHYPFGVAVDASGNLYIADNQNNRVRKVNSSGIISTIAGNGTAGYNGDGWNATAAELQEPTSIAFDASGNVYIADAGNMRIREVNTSGIISTFAGNGIQGYSGDGYAATNAELNLPTGVAIDASGTVYIADRANNVVRRVFTSGGMSGTIWTLAGGGSCGSSYCGDCGLSGSAALNSPIGVACDAYGNIYIGDWSNFLIRKLWPTYAADAGPNQINQQDGCGGWPGVQIGTPAILGIGGLTYVWSPCHLNPGKLSSCAIAQPISSWTNTTTPFVYTLHVTVEGCTATTSTVMVTAMTNSCSGCCIPTGGRLANAQTSCSVTVT
ncbi:MAG TPA: NHL repeat-containing protein, partial [Bacteroidia bacterium]